MGLKVRKGGRRPRLEVRSNLDLGWYDGGVSLVDEDDEDNDGENDPKKLRVRVHFTGFEETDDEFWGLDILRSEHEIRKRVRLISHQLQDKECDEVSPHMVVCANYKSSDGVESKYYDALVTAVSKAAHGRQDRHEICHCNFIIQWQEGPARGSYATVNCADISLIVQRDVGNHPVVRALLDFARDYSVVIPAVFDLAKPEGSLASPQNASNREHEISPQEEFDTEIVDQEDFEVEIPDIEEFEELQQFSSQEGFGKEKPEEANQEQDTREDRVEVIEVHKREGIREENLKVNEVRIPQTSDDENLEVEREQGEGATTQELPEIEEVQDQKTVEMEFEEKQNEEREGLMEDEPEAEQKQEELKHGVDAIELDWDAELQVEKLMEEFDSRYRAWEDNLLDLPKEIADHLRNFQLVQDCLAKETLEIEKLLEKRQAES